MRRSTFNIGQEIMDVIEKRTAFYKKYNTSESKKLQTLMTDREKIEFAYLDKYLNELNIESMKAQGFK